MYAACSARRLSRRPSPTRRTRSNFPNDWVATGLGYRLFWGLEPRSRQETLVLVQLVTVHSPDRDVAADSVALRGRRPPAQDPVLLHADARPARVRRGRVRGARDRGRSDAPARRRLRLRDVRDHVGNGGRRSGGPRAAKLVPGDVFGEIAVLSGGRRTASVVATRPMQLVTVLNRDMWRLEQDVPDVAAASARRSRNDSTRRRRVLAASSRAASTAISQSHRESLSASYVRPGSRAAASARAPLPRGPAGIPSTVASAPSRPSELEHVAFRSGAARDSDRAGPDGPQLGATAGDRTERRRSRFRARPRATSGRIARRRLDDEAPVGERDELRLLARLPGASTLRLRPTRAGVACP